MYIEYACLHMEKSASSENMKLYPERRILQVIFIWAVLGEMLL